jgi:uncharacterized protein YjbI with pentapeptide repeats
MSIQDPQPGPISQHLVKMQANVQQALSGATYDRHPVQEKPQRKSAHWTGFGGKTLWDWFNLLGATVLIPLVIAAATIGFGWQQNQLAQKQHDGDQAIALDQQRQAIFQAYEDDIKDLLLTKGLQTSKPGDGVRTVARAETLSALRQLDGERKGLLIQFLSEGGLISQNTDGYAIIPLTEADLREANLSLVDLSRVDLTFAQLNGTNLRGAVLREAFLAGADLEDADLRGANLTYVQLSGANLRRADLRGSHLQGADLEDADLQGANFQGATMPDGSGVPPT